MWKTRSDIEWGNPSIWRCAKSAEMSSTHARGSAWAPLPRRSSVSSRCDMVIGSTVSDGTRVLCAGYPALTCGLFITVAFATRENLASSAAGEIFFFQDAAMMEFVAGDGVSDAAHGDFVV